VSSQVFNLPPDWIPDEMVSCEESILKIQLFGPIDANEVIKVTLPSNVSFVRKVSGDVVVNSSNSQEPTFTLNNSLTSPDDNITIVYKVIVDCEFDDFNAILKYELVGNDNLTKVGTWSNVIKPLFNISNITPISTSLSSGNSQVINYTINQEAASSSSYVTSFQLSLRHSENIALSYSGTGVFL